MAHTKYLAERLQKIADGEQKHLIVEMPPRSGKSITITETFPSYYIGRNPDKRVITAAYSDGLARKFGRLNRNKLIEFGTNIFGVSLANDNGTVNNWGIDDSVGGMIATGIGGSITGEGADCIRNFSLVDTEAGRIRVDDLHKMKCKPMVLSYNHNKGDVEFKEAQVTRRVKTNEVTTISTVSGREITSTKEHNHFDFERGYREAHLFRPGDKLTIQTVEVEQALQSMWEKERWSWDILSRLLPISTQRDRSIRMQFMQKSLRNPYVRIQKEIKKWLSTFLLRLRMQRLSQLIQNFTPLRDMWKRNKKRQNVLFEGVSTSIQKHKKTKKNVRGLSQGVSERGFKKTDVFKGMFQRNGKQNVQIQNKKFDRSKGISRYSSKNIRKRRSSLFCLWYSREENGNVERNKTFKFSSSSQRREYSEQLNKKFNNCLSQLPYNSSSIEGEEIQSVTTERVDEYVYDIQVEDNHNFFANGVLVHNCLIIDDPIKNNEEAQSQTMRDKVWDEWETTLSTRLHKGASVIVVMTRWHEDDFVGRLLERSPYNWERIRMPAIAEDDNDLLGREVGTSLAPELGYDEEWAEIKKKEVGSKTWASLYQQRPSASEGNIFNRNWWQYYESLPRFFDEQIISWDLTFKDNNDNDYVVGQVWGRKGADYYLVDQVRDKMDFPTTVTAVRNLSNKYPRAAAKLIEDKANGPAVIATLKREVNGIIPVNPQGSKVARAQAITPFIESGNVFLPKHKEFSYDLIEEAAAFPNGKHDDQVDSASQALSRLASRKQAGISSVNIW